MNPSSIPDTNVEDMSNAELFQYLFKAEIGAGDLPAVFTDVLLQDASTTITVDDSIPMPYSPSSSTASTVAQSPYASVSASASPATLALSPSHEGSSPSSSSSSSPSSTTLAYMASPPSYQNSLLSEQQQSLFQPLVPTLLPTSMFSFRQISPDMPPSMPSPIDLTTMVTPPDLNDQQFLQLVDNATGTSAAPSSMASEQASLWMHRLQKFQELQQAHQSQQRQLLLDSPLFNSSQQKNISSNNVLSFGAGSTSTSNPLSKEGSSPQSSTSLSPSVKSEKDMVIYPSPPMKDDFDMDSEDEEMGDGNGQNGSSDLKPSAAELKKLTSKERRQLRNKLSARNFRVRRKEYISTLENQVKEARKEAAELQKKLAQSELNCQFMRQELETVRLSQTLFNDGRMSREHANLLASLLNPNTESFPATSTSTNATSSNSTLLQQKELMESISHNDMTILNHSLTLSQDQLQQAQLPLTPVVSDTPHGSLEPFVPFDGDWDLLVNRAEIHSNPVLDPKESTKESVYQDLLTRYESAKREAEMDELMRKELKAHHEQKLAAQTYIVMPKEESTSSVLAANQDSLLLQTMVHMMMIHLTRSLFQAATLSNSQIVNVYQTMDEPLRSKMGQEQQERPPCMFAEWREAWIKRYWPSFYNNRQRVCELLKHGLCPSAGGSAEVDMDETVRKMEEGVKDKTVSSSQTSGPFYGRIRDCIASWLRCPEYLARQERERLQRERVAAAADGDDNESEEIRGQKQEREPLLEVTEKEFLGVGA